MPLSLFASLVAGGGEVQVLPVHPVVLLVLRQILLKQPLTLVHKVPDSLPSGAVLSINPDITLNSELLSGNSVNASYKPNFSTDFPTGNHDIVVRRADSGDRIELSFIVSDKLVKLVLENFWDIGGTGHTDGFTVYRD